MSQHRYRITVTPIETDGLPCTGRCTIEFEHRSQHDWMRLMECSRRQARLGGDERASVAVATQLLRGLALRHAQDPAHPLSTLQPELDALLDRLEALQPHD